MSITHLFFDIAHRLILFDVIFLFLFVIVVVIFHLSIGSSKEVLVKP